MLASSMMVFWKIFEQFNWSFISENILVGESTIKKNIDYTHGYLPFQTERLQQSEQLTTADMIRINALQRTEEVRRFKMSNIPILYLYCFLLLLCFVSVALNTTSTCVLVSCHFSRAGEIVVLCIHCSISDHIRSCYHDYNN